MEIESITMVNITHKTYSLRQAVASAVLQVSHQSTIQAIRARAVPKGDVFEFSRAAGLLAIKKTSDVIPDCHPLPVEFASITYEINELQVIIRVEVHTIYKTGVEVEAMHGAAVTALTMYDMLKPIDKNVSIGQIKLDSKKGGKSDREKQAPKWLQAAVVVCSDSVAAGKNEDISGKLIVKRLEQSGMENISYRVIADETAAVQDVTRELAAAGIKLIVFTGGTGLGQRDITPDALQPLITKFIPGVMETARHYGQQRMPFAMLSRGLCGFMNETLLLTLPGSPAAVKETMDAVFPQLLHVFDLQGNSRHQG